MTTDRPDKTESAFTLSPGRFQLEATAYSYSEDEREIEGEQEETFTENVGDFQIRAGVTENGEIQFMMPAFIEERVRTRQGVSRSYGSGDVVLRYRQNLYGNNDPSKFAWAAMPYVKIPTANNEFSNNMVEGGAMFPFAFNLPKEWSMGTMFDLNRAYNEADNSWRNDYAMTWVVSKRLFNKFSGFVELYSQISDDEDREAVGTFDLGVTWQYNSDLQFDVGSFIGITDAAVDETFFLGVAWRL